MKRIPPSLPGVKAVATNSPETAGPGPLTCRRCGAELRPGGGTFYRVVIHATADPTPPALSAPDLATDVRPEIERLLAQLADLSEEELLAQVYRRLTLYLCGPCYRQWIEDPCHADPGKHQPR
jgi:hypothetical protein